MVTRPSRMEKMVVDDNFEETIESKNMSFIFFGSSNCPYCEEVKKILKKIESKTGAYVCSVPKRRVFFQKYQVDTIPTVLVFKKDIFIDVLIGKTDEKAYDCYF